MSVEFARKTVGSTLQIEGHGLHSGSPVTVRIEPSRNGLKLHCGENSVAVCPENVTDTSRCTRLGHVSTVEHCLAALGSYGVTDADIILTEPEFPAMSGGSDEYVAAIEQAGLTTIGSASLSLFERVFYKDGDVTVAIGKGEGHWRYEFISGDRWPGFQSFECSLAASVFRDEIAAARTFAFEEEVDGLLAMGLAKGLDLSTALILGKDGYSNQANWPDEPARHKMLDLIGDLFLCRIPPNLLNVVGHKSGHRTNVEAARRLYGHAKIEWA